MNPIRSENPTASPPQDFPHEGLARACARRFVGRGVAMEDLLQEARAAVWLAEQRFDPGRGLQFSTYAVPLILGALRDCCRRAAPMHIPRREARQIGQALREASGGAQDGQPEDTAPQLLQMLAAYSRMRSLTAEGAQTVPAAGDSFEERVLLREAVRQLGPPYGPVIGLRYLCGLSQRETGLRLGAPQWQVCRWEKMALGMLREIHLRE